VTAVVVITTFCAGALFWAGLFPYTGGHVPRVRLLVCSAVLLVVAVVSAVVGAS
jgi:hypothetical protein